MPRVQVTILAGRNLPIKTPYLHSTTSDPYVKFRWRGEKYKTKVIEEDLNPTWNQTFTLDV